MQAALKLIEIFSPSGLAGPIFDKELRVSSRRKRTYVLRSLYILIMLVLILFAWGIIAQRPAASAAFRSSRMSEAGQAIIITMAWFQFITAQMIAVALFSNSISGEIHQKTLDVLMTTPVTCLQIVIGKLMSGLLQLFLLLSISFTVLGIIRVYGGIQWDYVLSTYCVTITSSILAASLSLMMSIKIRHPYKVIVAAVIIYFVSFGIFGNIGIFAAGSLSHYAKLVYALAFLNPFWAFMLLQSKTIPGLGAFGISSFNWPAHCMTILAISVLIIAVSTVMVRKSALQQLAPAVPGKKRKKRIHKRSASAVEMKYMVGSPVITGIASKSAVWGYAGFALLALFVIISSLGNSMPFFFMRSNISLLWLIALIRTGSMAATSMAKEKESRSLVLLLTTPLTSRQIINAKVFAALRRNAPLWLLIILASLLNYLSMFLKRFPSDGVNLLNPLINSACLLVSVPVCAYFLAAVGVYYGVRNKNQTSAVTGFLVFSIGAYIINAVLSGLLVGIVSFTLSAVFDFANIYVILQTAVFVISFLSIAIIVRSRAIANLRKFAF